VLDNRHRLPPSLGRDGDSAVPSGDSELLLALLEREGDEVLQRLAGQFALAWWQPRERRLLLARDRIGYAPLHFAVDRAGRFVFASEYKALLALDTIDARPNRDAIQVLQNTKWAKPAATCLMDVHPVAPGTSLGVSERGIEANRFWHIPVRVEHDDEERHAAALRDTFIETMRAQTRPYARVGVSLSGGLDSAVMAAGARHVIGERELHTFTAGYGPDDVELVNAAAVSRELGTIHHPVVLRPSDLPDLFPWMAWHLEEPIGREDIAYLFVAARTAARHVDVILAGFGFDGLFAGLPRHRLVDLGLKFPPARRALEEFYDYSVRSVEPPSLMGRLLRNAYFRGKTYPAPRVVGAEPVARFSGFPRDSHQPLTQFLRRGFLLNPYQFAIERLYSSVGLRMNAHHTDPAFIEAAFSIPDRLKIKGKTQKYILRKACSGLLPDRMLAFGKSFNRLKHDTELSGVLDEMATRWLSRDRLVERGLFEPSYVEGLRRRPQGQPYSQERAYRLWSLLLTEAWCQRFLDERGAAPRTALPPIEPLALQHARGEPSPSLAVGAVGPRRLAS
jgi:asparagine synthase (glutamine-hydrolysing)